MKILSVCLCEIAKFCTPMVLYLLYNWLANQIIFLCTLPFLKSIFKLQSYSEDPYTFVNLSNYVSGHANDKRFANRFSFTQTYTFQLFFNYCFS